MTFKGKAVLFVLRHQKALGFLLKHTEIGEFETTSGVKYKGVRIKWRW